MATLTTLQPILGLALLIGLAWALSEQRRRFPWQTVAVGLSLQFGLALLLLKLPGSQWAFRWITHVVDAMLQATQAGTTMVFGFLGGGPLPYDETVPGGSFVFALRVLPLVVLVSAISAVLYHYRVLPLVVRGFAWVLGKSFRISGASSFALSANVFIGMVEAPLLVRPYLERMSRSELFVLMTGGMATIAGTVFAVYATLLKDIIPDAAGHLLTASLISAPAAVVIAVIMSPQPEAEVDADVQMESLYENGVDAVTRGTMDGLRLLAHIIGMLIVLVALVELVNIILGLAPDVDGGALTVQRALGWCLAPLVWTLGIPWNEAVTAGQLMGTKIVLNEFLAYLSLADLPAGALGERSALIMAYALCGFANFASLGIMLGGIGALVPERRFEIAQLGLKSVFAGNAATLMTGAVAALLSSW